MNPPRGGTPQTEGSGMAVKPEYRVRLSVPTVQPMPAHGNALGDRTATGQALKGRAIGGVCRSGMARVWAAPSGLGLISLLLPRALPWAGMVGPFGAQKPGARRVAEHRKQRGAVWQ